MALPQRYIEKDRDTEEEYLRWEQDAAYKSEYVRGDIRAMSGGTDDHATIIGSMSAELRRAVRQRGCRTMPADMKVRTGEGTFRYPDVTVVCGPSRYHGPGQAVITNPLLLVEVLSPSTAATDRGEKLGEYQSIKTLQCYLLVSQDAPRVECYERRDGGHWDSHAVTGRESDLVIASLDITLSLNEIYDQIAFTEQGREQQE